MAGGLRVAREGYSITFIDRREALRYLGYGGQKLTPELEGRIETITERCLSLASPRATLASFVVSKATQDAVLLDDCALTLTGSDIASHLADATEVVLLAATIGSDIDRELRRLSLTDALGQVIFDAVASCVIERCADAAEAHARAYAASLGCYSSWRFSPGYGNLPLSVQPAFLAATDATRQLGITLTPSHLMVPTKSVTAIVGIHPAPQPGLASSCALCSLSDFCTIRQTGRTCRD